VLCQLQTAVGQRSLPLLQQDLRLLGVLLQRLQAAVQLLLLPAGLLKLLLALGLPTQQRGQQAALRCWPVAVERFMAAPGQ